MLTVWKYKLPLGVGVRFELSMPRGARPIAFGLDHAGSLATPVVWVEVDDSMPIVPVRFEMLATGHIRLGGAVYVGTIQTVAPDETPLVIHLYHYP